MLYGDRGILEIEGDRITLSERSGHVEDFSVADAPDDSYHSAWFGKMADDFTRAIADGNASAVASHNLAEARAALALIRAARQSASEGGSSVRLE